MKNASHICNSVLLCLSTAALLSGGPCHGAGMPEVYRDIPVNHWASEAVRCLVVWGVIGEGLDGPFKGEQIVSRAEGVICVGQIVKAITRLSAKPLPAPPQVLGFDDVPSNHWASAAVDELKELGIMEGYPSFVDIPQRHWCYQRLSELTQRSVIPAEEKLRPKDPLLRRAAIEWLARGFGYGLKRQSTGSEERGVLWKQDGTEVDIHEVLAGDPSGRLRLDEPVTRYELVVMVQKLINQFFPEMKCPK